MEWRVCVGIGRSYTRTHTPLHARRLLLSRSRNGRRMVHTDAWRHGAGTHDGNRTLGMYGKRLSWRVHAPYDTRTRGCMLRCMIRVQNTFYTHGARTTYTTTDGCTPHASRNMTFGVRFVLRTRVG